MAGQSGGEGLKTVRVALVADPGLPVKIARRVATELPDKLSRRLPDKNWDVDVVCKALIGDEEVSVGSVLHTTRGRLVTPGLRGWLRLFVGMVRANRPWLLFRGLSKAEVGEPVERGDEQWEGLGQSLQEHLLRAMYRTQPDPRDITGGGPSRPGCALESVSPIAVSTAAGWCN